MHESNKLKKLNLTLCKDTKIEISIAVKINGTLDKYNSSSGYYNDICSKTTSENGTDISLKDRRNEFVDNNMSLCEENCDLIEYNYTKEKAKCSCDVKTSIPPNFDIKFNKKDFFKSFTDVKNIFNINILKCYKTVLKIKSLKKNYGFYIIASVFLLYIITLIIFPTISYRKLKKEVKNIIFALKYDEFPVKDNKNINKPLIINKKKRKHHKRDSNKWLNKENNIFENNKIKEKNNKLLNLNDSKNNNINIEDNTNYKININEKMKIEKNKDPNTMKQILDKKEFELSSLAYEEALKLDHRNYCQYYISLLKYNHPISFSFGPYNDYNSKIIKIFLFFFSFSLDFTVNALFFTDDTMHKIYQDKGQFNFLYQIPQIIYSTIISKTIDSIIKNFSFTQENLVELKQATKIKHFKKMRKKLLFALKIKFILFFVLTFIFLVFFWYYITCFCGIYINTQMHLFKDSFFSIITSLFIPFALCLIPGIFRISALKVKKPKRRCMYKFSLFLDNCIG